MLVVNEMENGVKPLYKPITEKKARAEIRRMFREHKKEVFRTMLIIRGYELATWAVINSKKL